MTRKTVILQRFLTVFIICSVVTAVSAHIVLKQYADIVCRSSCWQYGEQLISKAVSKTLEDFDLDGIISDDDTGYYVNSDMINEISLSLVDRINDSLSDELRSYVSVPAGAFTGISFLSGSGPDIRIDIYAVGSPKIELTERFESAGINQSLYELYAEVSVSFSAVMPSKSVTVTVSRQVLLAHRVIIGEVPQLYYPQSE